MPLVVYLDETGDHSLELVDKGFPVFALVMFVCDTHDYANAVVPAVYQLKMDQWGHEGVILHSRDIRKAQKDFGFLTDPAARPPFYERINRIMRESSYRLIASVIKKQAHKDRYGTDAHSPYTIALTFAMERLLPMLEEAGQEEVHVIAEARGKSEDDALQLVFLNIVTSGTMYVEASRFRKIRFHLHFHPKAMNIVGTQLADLAAYPIARHVIDPGRPNPAYDVVATKFYVGPGRVHGLKVFP